MKCCKKIITNILLPSCCLILPVLFVTASISAEKQSTKTDMSVADAKYDTPHFQVDTPKKIMNANSNVGIVTFQFAISNAGSKPLTLKVLNTSCGCTSAKLLHPVLKYGDVEHFEVKIQTVGFVDKAESVTLSTNDPQNQEVTLNCIVKMPLNAIPINSTLDIEGWQGESYHRTMFLSMKKGVSIKRVSSHLPFIHTRMLPIKVSSEGIIQPYEVDITKNAPVGSFTDKITFLLSNSSAQTVVVPVRGVIKSNIEVSPKQLFLGQMVPGTTINELITVSTHDGKKIKILKVECNDLEISTKIDTQKYASKHLVKISIKNSQLHDYFIHSKLKIVCDTGDVVMLPIDGMLLSR